MAVFPSFIFDTSKGETPQTIAMKRALAAQIMGGFGNRPARNVGEGVGNAFASLGQGITANVMNRRAAAGEEAGQATAGDLRQQLINSMMGQSSFPAAPNPGNTSSMASMAAPDYASARVAQAHNAGSPLPNSFLSAVDQTEGAGGYDTLFGHAQRGPFAGTDVSQMTIGDALAFASPSGAYGQHVKGQIGRVATPMGRHQIVGTTLRNAVQELGLDPSVPFDANTQDTIAAHLARRRIAGANTMDGKVSALRSEWEGFKNVPRAQMEQIVHDLEAAPATQPSASGLTPEALQAWGATAYAPMPAGGALGAVNALGAAQPVPVAETEADILAQEAAMAQQDPMAFAAQGAMPQAAPMQQQPVQVAQAGGFPEMAGRDPSRQPPPDLNMLMQVLSNPFMDEGTKAYAQAVLQQHMQAQDPVRQLQLEKGRLEVEAMRNPQPKDTDDIREYNYARQQGYQGSFTDFMTDMRRAGATSVNVGAGEKAWDQESAKLFAKRYDDISAGAMNAQQMMGMYDLAEQALNSGVRTGLGAEAELTLRQMGAAMGMDTDPEKLAGGELIRAVQNRMALTMRSPDGGMGMPGALSDRDIKFLKDSQIGIDRSPEGNRRMLEAFRAMENRKIEIARLADDYIAQNGRLDSGFNQMVREYASSNPLFPEGPKKITTQDEFNALPSGAEFVAPDGSIRRKP